MVGYRIYELFFILYNILYIYFIYDTYDTVTGNSKVGLDVQKWWRKEKATGTFIPGRRSLESKMKGVRNISIGLLAIFLCFMS